MLSSKPLYISSRSLFSCSIVVWSLRLNWHAVKSFTGSALSMVKRSKHGRFALSSKCSVNTPLSQKVLPLGLLERYFITMLDEHSTSGRVDEAGLHLFAKQRSYEAIPPTSASLVLYVKRSALKAACVRGHGNSVALPTGAGTKMVKSGEFSGQAFHPDGISCTPNCVQCVDQRNRIVQSKKKSSKTVRNCCEWRPSWNMVVILKVVFRESERPVLVETPGILIWLVIIRSLPFSVWYYPAYSLKEKFNNSRNWIKMGVLWSRRLNRPSSSGCPKVNLHRLPWTCGSVMNILPILAFLPLWK